MGREGCKGPQRHLMNGISCPFADRDTKARGGGGVGRGSVQGARSVRLIFWLSRALCLTTEHFCQRRAQVGIL